MWTASFHEMSKLTNKKIIPVEKHGQYIKSISSQIFKNNPTIIDVDLCENAPGDHIVIPMNIQETNYCKLDTPHYAKHRYDKHIIEQVLEYYNIPGTIKDVRCRLYLTDQEKQEVLHLTSKLSKEFVTIEPHSNDEYTCNRSYPFEKWQKIVDELNKHIQVVQVGSAKRTLNGVTNLTCKTTFRTCAGVIGQSKLFLSTEGGLVHAAHAMQTKSVVVITGYEHPKMVAYPQNTNIWVHGDHGPCGNKQFCQQCWSEVSKHDEQEIVNAAVKEIS